MTGSNDDDSVLEQATKWRTEGRKTALATVIATWGSAPRPAGSQLAVNEDGAFVGSVSGGCVEGAVVAEALRALRDGGFRLLEFGVSDADAWTVGLACGGRIRIAVDPVADYLAAILELKSAGRPAVVATRLATGESRVLDPADVPDDPLAGAAGEALSCDRARIAETADGEIFLNVYNPPLRLAVIGAVHVAQHLCRMAELAGFAVTLIDPRSGFANEARFPGIALVREWPDTALAAYQPDSRTAVVTLTHDPKLDDPALDSALRSNCFYIGALGSRKTHDARLARLAARGHDETALARLHGPVGLAIGAKSPAEIAVSIVAELIATLRQGGGRT